MQKKSISVAVFGILCLSACSSTQVAGNDGGAPASVTAVKGETVQLSTEFRREGVRVYYTLFGNVDRIEAKGFAEVWQQRYEHVAELEAKEKLVKFLRGESVSSTRKTQVIARAIERAQDSTLNRSKSSDGAMNSTAEDLELEAMNKAKESDRDEISRANTALRKTSFANAQTVTSTITVTSSGRLVAVRKLSGEVVNDGKLYVGTYIWTPKDQEASRSIIKMMDAR